ncbi:MAG: transcriptional regulator [Lachnospiraceae bacterium]|nr:transcriptional regulator [Lachnospiraceae bacterium]
MEAREELRKLRESTGMNRKEFCEYFEIPYMTETDWELGNRRVPQYLLRLMAYKVEMEKLSDKRNKTRAMNQQIDNVLVIVQQLVA